MVDFEIIIDNHLYIVSPLQKKGIMSYKIMGLKVIFSANENGDLCPVKPDPTVDSDLLIAIADKIESYYM